MRWARRETSGAQHDIPHTQPAKPVPWRTWPPTSSVRPPTQSRPSAPPLRPPRPSLPADASASGSETNSPTRSANSYSTTNASATTSAGPSSTADGLECSELRHCPIAALPTEMDAYNRRLIDRYLHEL